MIRIVKSRRPGKYKRRHVFINGRWVKWVGFAALPIGQRSWVGLAIETQSTPPQGQTFYKHDKGHRYKLGYNPETREPLDE